MRTLSNFKQGTKFKFRVSGKTFMSLGIIKPIGEQLKVVLTADPITGAENGWYYLQDLKNGLRAGIVIIENH